MTGATAGPDPSGRRSAVDGCLMAVRCIRQLETVPRKPIRSKDQIT